MPRKIPPTPPPKKIPPTPPPSRGPGGPRGKVLYNGVRHNVSLQNEASGYMKGDPVQRLTKGGALAVIQQDLGGVRVVAIKSGKLMKNSGDKIKLEAGAVARLVIGKRSDDGSGKGGVSKST